jgi:hypothetical protein
MNNQGQHAVRINGFVNDPGEREGKKKVDADPIRGHG